MATTVNALARADYRKYWRPSLVFHVLMQAIGVALIAPLLSWLARRLVRLAGNPVITNFDLLGFVFSPVGLLFILVVVSISIGILLAEFAGQSWIAGHAMAGRKATAASTVAFVLKRLPRLLGLGGRIFVRLALIAAPFLLAGALLWATTLREQDINYYLAEHPPEWKRAMVIGALLLLGFLFFANRQLARWIFAIPLIVFDRLVPARALDESARLTKGRVGQIVPRIAAWWLPLLVLVVLAIWLGRQFSDVAFDWAGINFRRVLPLVVLFAIVASIFSLAWSGLALAGHQFIVTRLFASLRDTPLPSPWQDEDAAVTGPGATRVATRVTLLVLALFAAGLFVGIRLASSLADDSTVAVTAHRGASIGAPENTMASFSAAMAAGADFIELDVQRASDGTVVVVHDGDLMRLGGDPRKVGSLAWPDFGSIDVGSHFDPGFAAERVPTLEQVIDLVRGQMKINVELKYNVPDPELAPAVIDLLRSKQFLDQVVITSLDAAALRQVKGIDPDVQTGLIVTASVGNVAQTEADFVSLNAAQATTSLVRRMHAAGKQVHVWTVNTPEAMQVMMERGVDNIITDDPALFRKVMGERAGLNHGEKLALRLRVLFDRPPREATDPEAVKTL